MRLPAVPLRRPRGSGSRPPYSRCRVTRRRSSGRRFPLPLMRADKESCHRERHRHEVWRPERLEAGGAHYRVAHGREHRRRATASRRRLIRRLRVPCGAPGRRSRRHDGARTPRNGSRWRQSDSQSVGAPSSPSRRQRRNRAAACSKCAGSVGRTVARASRRRSAWRWSSSRAPASTSMRIASHTAISPSSISSTRLHTVEPVSRRNPTHADVSIRTTCRDDGASPPGRPPSPTREDAGPRQRGGVRRRAGAMPV